MIAEKIAFARNLCMISRSRVVSLAAIIVMIVSNAGCTAWKPWQGFSKNQLQAGSREKSVDKVAGMSSGLGGSKPNTRQAQIDLAIAAAERHEANQEYREAIKRYQEVLVLDKKSGLAHHRLALISSRLSATKQAQEHFEEARRFSPKDDDILADYAYWNYLNAQDEQANAMIDEGLRRSPDYERFHGIKGLLLAREKQWERSVESFVRSGCTPQQAWANIGHVVLLEGDVQSASYWIEHAAQGDQGSATAKRTQKVLQTAYTAPVK